MAMSANSTAQSKTTTVETIIANVAITKVARTMKKLKKRTTLDCNVFYWAGNLVKWLSCPSPYPEQLSISKNHKRSVCNEGKI
jgi:hypothetical protein